MLFGHSIPGYPMHHPYTTTAAATDCYTPPYTQIKMEYPPCGPVSSCMGLTPSSYMVPMPPHPACTSATGVSMPSSVVPSSVYSTSIPSTGKSLQDGHISEVCTLIKWVCALEWLCTRLYQKKLHLAVVVTFPLVRRRRRPIFCLGPLGV